MYHDTVDTMKESEHKFKQEVLGQKRTIQNLQEVLIKTKQNLEELQEKSNIEVGLNWTSRWFSSNASNESKTSRKNKNNNNANTSVHDV